MVVRPRFISNRLIAGVQNSRSVSAFTASKSTLDERLNSTTTSHHVSLVEKARPSSWKSANRNRSGQAMYSDRMR